MDVTRWDGGISGGWVFAVDVTRASVGYLAGGFSWLMLLGEVFTPLKVWRRTVLAWRIWKRAVTNGVRKFIPQLIYLSII